MIFCFLILSLSVLAQTAAESQPGTTAADETSTAAASETADSAAQNDAEAPTQTEDAGTDEFAEEESLLSETLKKDIESASYYELQNWCMRLRLQDTGSASELRSRLTEYYQASGEGISGGGSGEKITIDNAEATQYFEIEQIDESYVRLIGNVSILLEDSKTGSTHQIRADNILFNQKQKYITAIGNVRYERKSGDATDIFSGESLTFDIEDWEGVIFRGVTQKDQEVEEGDTSTFYYTGDRIIKNKDNNITMENGVITSVSNLEDPYFSVSADKIWILGPGEWAVKNMTLRVGYVPLLYFPYFLYWGDHIFFNPNFGTDTEKGAFMQTTTYLLGSKTEEDDNTFSFMDYNSDSSDYEKKINGLFLANVKKDPDAEETEAQKLKKKLESNESFTKIYFDVYPTYGLFAGITGELKQIEQLKELNYFFALGLRPIATNENFFYLKDTTPDIENEADKVYLYKPFYQQSYLFDKALPFRFKSEFDMTVSDTGYNIRLKMPYYSDKDFEVDYLSKRKETFDWKGLIGLSEEDDTTETTKTVSEFQWDLTSSFNINPVNEDVKKFMDKYFKLNISALNFSLNYGVASFTGFQYAKDPETGEYNQNEPLDDYYVDANDPRANYTSYFYRPKTYTAPDLKLTLSGTFFEHSLTSGTASADTASVEEIVGFKTPWEETENEEEGTEAAGIVDFRTQEQPPLNELFRQNNYLTDNALSYAVTDSILKHSLRYNVSNINLKLTGDTRYNDWQYPIEIDMSDMDFHRLYFAVNGSLTYDMDLYNSTLVLSNVLETDFKYRWTYDVSDPDDPYSTSSSSSGTQTRGEYYAQDDLKERSFVLRNKFNLRLNPLKSISALSSTNISYNLTTKLLEIGYDSSVQSNIDNGILSAEDVVKLDKNSDYYMFLPAWNRDTVEQHSLDFNFVSTVSDMTQNISLSAYLPPLNLKFQPKFSFDFKMFNFSLSLPFNEVTQEDLSKEWEYGDLSFSSQFKLYEDLISMTQSAQYNMQDNYLKTSSTSFKMNLFDSNLTFTQSFDVALDNYVPVPSRAAFGVKIWYFSLDFVSANSYLKRLNTNTGTWSDITETDHTETETDFEKRLRPRSVNLQFNYNYESDPLFKNRLTLGFDVGFSYEADLLQYTNSTISFKLSFNMKLFNLFEVSFGSTSLNSTAFLYSRKNAADAGLENMYRNPFRDILMSFNFFDEEDRKASYFKLKTLDLKVTVPLMDWDLVFEYNGYPKQFTDSSGIADPYERWARTFSISVQWRSIGMFKNNIRVNELDELVLE